MSPVPSALRIEGLGLQIGGATILKDVDLDIAPGSLVGVIGPTRLNYARVVPMVDFTAQALTRLMA